MSSAENDLTSQSRFCKYFDKSLLREFICRSLTRLNGLVREELANSQVLQKYPKLYIDPNFDRSREHRSDIYLILNFKVGQSKIAHISFHLTPNQCSTSQPNGPLHVVNNSSKRRRTRLRIIDASTPNCKSIMITLGSQLVPQFNISSDVREMTEATLRVLNRWFEPGNPNHLRNGNRCSIDAYPYRREYTYDNRRTNSTARWHKDKIERIKNS